MIDLASVAAATADSLASPHVAALAEALRVVPRYSPGVAALVKRAVPAPHQFQVDALIAAWAQEPETSGQALALALKAAMAVRQRSMGPRVEVVVTGPSSLKAPVRLTSEVVKQLIASASERVTIVSFASYRVAAVIEALDAAVGRGVVVQVILESPEKLKDGGGGAAYAKYETFEWPIKDRPSDASLHAKAVIVDGRDVLLTSANMTNYAYDKNIELGVLCRGGDVAQRVQDHFDGLISGGVLRLL